MSRKPDEKSVENPPHDEEATGTVLRLVPRAERERQAKPTAGNRSGSDRVQIPRRDGDDDDPGPSAA
jgi:hypothetical protein